MAGERAAGEDLSASDGQRWVPLGRITGVYGVRGWVKVYSDTVPVTNILDYPRWHLEQNGRREERGLLEGRPHGKGIVARLEGCNDRDQALLLIGAQIAVPRGELPEPTADQYYWADLEGLQVVTLEGVELGRIDHLFGTGANDVMVVRGERERLLPFIDTVVCAVDLEQGRLTVDWDPGF